MTGNTKISTVEQYIDSVRNSFESDLKQLVEIPGISMDPERKQDILATAEKAVELIGRAGGHAEVVQTAGYPVVFGQFPEIAGAPTVVIYNHMDVQPADPEGWNTSPFEMMIEDGVYRGRGTTDDKGPALTALYAAKFARESSIPLNIKFVWELEEEIGSPSFQDFLKANRARLECDSVLISDTIWVSRDKPAIPYGLRGLQGLILRLKTGAKDVHSGLTGGLARNPVAELCQIISSCFDAVTGQVKIPGFYDQVAPVKEEELNNFVDSGFSVDGFKKAHELISTRTENPRAGAEAIWAKPTFEVHGIVGGYSGPGVKTIVPHSAEAKISMRLVPDQDPEHMLGLVERFVSQICPDVEVVAEGSLEPYLGDFSGPFAEAASRAMEHAFGVEPAFTREGGSIGAVVSMNDVLKVPIVFLGLSLPEHGYHAVNENYDWQQASGGMKMFVEYFRLICELKNK